NSSFSSHDIEWLFSLETYNNNEGYELDKILPEKPYYEKGSDDEGSDDMEGVEDINALDYAIWTDKLNELVSQLKNFIEAAKEELSNNQENIDSIVGDPIQVKHKGRQPN
ncbi:16525_t:CDS:2, partial [Rhizophagus irregularis]